MLVFDWSTTAAFSTSNKNYLGSSDDKLVLLPHHERHTVWICFFSHKQLSCESDHFFVGQRKKMLSREMEDGVRFGERALDRRDRAVWHTHVSKRSPLTTFPGEDFLVETKRSKMPTSRSADECDMTYHSSSRANLGAVCWYIQNSLVPTANSSLRRAYSITLRATPCRGPPRRWSHHGPTCFPNQ